MTRRTLLADLGRTAVAAAVLGPAVGACAGEGDDPAADDAGADVPEGRVAWERASFGFVSAYVVARGGQAVVFDTGTGDDGVGPVTEALDALGLLWSDVAGLVVSHRHGDHAGGLEAVAAEAPGAVLHAAAPDLDAFRDRVDEATEVADGDLVLGLRIVATPGHTPGHISAFDESTGLLLAGDALVNGVTIGGTSGGGIEGSPPDFTDDMDAAAASVAALADLDPTTILFGHGDPVTEGAAEQLRALAG